MHLINLYNIQAFNAGLGTQSSLVEWMNKWRNEQMYNDVGIGTEYCTCNLNLEHYKYFLILSIV